MKLLLDSHIALWALGDPARLLESCRSAIEDGNNDVFVSAASIWELRLKWGRGKLGLPAEFEAALKDTGFTELPVRWAHAVRAAQLPPFHQDPFDRMLVAQSLLEDLVLVTRDPVVLEYDTALMRG